MVGPSAELDSMQAGLADCDTVMDVCDAAVCCGDTVVSYDSDTTVCVGDVSVTCQSLEAVTR